MFKNVYQFAKVAAGIAIISSVIGNPVYATSDRTLQSHETFQGAAGLVIVAALQRGRG